VNHGQEQQIIFQGEKARVSMPWKVTASVAKQNGFPEVNLELEQEITALADQVPALQYTGHKGQLDNVLAAIENGTGKVLVTGQEGRKTLELITAIYQAASTGTTVRLPLKPNSAFYTREGIMANAPRFYEKKNSVVGFSANEITVSGESK
jgi:predicted dehydrogenase